MKLHVLNPTAEVPLAEVERAGIGETYPAVAAAVTRFGGFRQSGFGREPGM